MDLPVIALGVLIGLILIAGKKRSYKESRSVSPRLNEGNILGLASTADQLHISDNIRFQPPHATYDMGAFPSYGRYSVPDHPRENEWLRRFVDPSFPELRASRQMASRKEDTKAMVESWRKSILGLIRLAERNLASAKQHLELKSYAIASEAAFTSVENIGRAILHCFGEKPDLDSGQEETLGLLLPRFQGEDRLGFEKAIEIVANLSRSRLVIEQLLTGTLTSETQLFIEEQVKQAIDQALKVFSLFRRIIDDRFATEIPELRETCPKCHLLDISVWSFDQDGTTYECKTCHHTWTLPTTL